MKRLQIMIDEDLDESLERQARDEGASKAALIRRYVRERLMPLSPIEEDPLWGLVGLVEGATDDSTRIDEVVYRRDAIRDLRQRGGGSRRAEVASAAR